MPASSLAPGRFWDRLGVLLSSLCAVHCLLMPVVLLALPFWHDAHAVHEVAHPLMAVLLVPVTWGAVRRAAAGASFLRMGLALVWVALPAHAVLGEMAGLVISLCGSALLILGHRCNLRCCIRRVG